MHHHSKDLSSIAMSASYLKLFLQFADEQGWERSSLLRGSDIIPESLDDNAYITIGQLEILLENAGEFVKGPALGLQLGKKLQLAAHGLMSHMVISADNMLSSMEAFQRFLRLRTSIVHFSVAVSEPYVTLDFQLTEAVGATQRFVLEASISGSCGLVRYLCAEDPIDQVCFNFPAPADPDSYQRALRTRVQFGANTNSIRMHLEHLLVPNETANAALHALAQQQAAAALAKLDSKQPLAETIYQLLLAQPEYFPSQEAMSVSLNMSTRSLRRQLNIEGSNYQQIIDRARYHLAHRYLHQHWSLEDIASLLGYTEVASFSRAFRRWAGQSPGQYRAQHS